VDEQVAHCSWTRYAAEGIADSAAAAAAVAARVDPPQFYVPIKKLTCCVTGRTLKRVAGFPAG